MRLYDIVVLVTPDLADDDAVRPHKVLDRGSFAEELRIRGDSERHAVRDPLGHKVSQPLSGADGHGRFRY